MTARLASPAMPTRYVRERFIRISAITVGHLLDAILDDYRINGKFSGWATIVCDTHLRPFFGSMPAVKLTSDDAR